MYREAGQWEEALRIVRAHGNDEESYSLALDWAIFVGPEVGGKLLLRHGVVHDCIELACRKELVRRFYYVKLFILCGVYLII